jgi:hypothetical protein
MLNIMSMTKKSKWIIAVPAIVLSALIITWLVFTGQGLESNYKLDVYKSGNGWGYNVVKSGKIFIHQPYVPVIQDNIPFPTRKVAQNAGKKVIEKLDKSLNPALSTDEISKLGVNVKPIKK